MTKTLTQAFGPALNSSVILCGALSMNVHNYGKSFYTFVGDRNLSVSDFLARCDDEFFLVFWQQLLQSSDLSSGQRQSVDQRFALLEAETNYNWTTLQLAAQYAGVEVVTALMDSLSVDQRFALLEAKTNKKWTPLHLAVRSAGVEVVTALME